MLDIYSKWIEDKMPRDVNGSVDHSLKMFFLWRTIRDTGANVFVESGTSHGDAIAAIRPFVSKVFSIEAHLPSYEYSSKRFVKDEGVQILFGNSAHLLEDIVTKVDDVAVVWLDAHYSGTGTALLDKETPIEEELRIFAELENKKNFSLVIDDARGFGEWNDYPSIDWVESFYSDNFSDSHNFWLEGDEIFIVTRGGS